VQNPNRVRWSMALRIVWAWLFTIQSAALIAAATYFAVKALGL
jgi:phosphate/sulfate permease